MAIWNSLSKKASETTAKAVQQAKMMTEVARLNSLVSDEEKKITNNYYQIGKLYVATHRDNYAEDFVGMIMAIAESEQKIKEYRAQIQDVKGVIKCGNCGAEVPKGIAFCSACGNAMPQVEVVDTSKHDKCASCGAMVEKGMRFCTSCGNAMTAPVINVSIEASKTACTNCGAALEADVAFCTECGTKI